MKFLWSSLMFVVASHDSISVQNAVHLWEEMSYEGLRLRCEKTGSQYSVSELLCSYQKGKSWRFFIHKILAGDSVHRPNDGDTLPHNSHTLPQTRTCSHEINWRLSFPALTCGLLPHVIDFSSTQFKWVSEVQLWRKARVFAAFVLRTFKASDFLQWKVEFNHMLSYFSAHTWFSEIDFQSIMGLNHPKIFI